MVVKMRHAPAIFGDLQSDAIYSKTLASDEASVSVVRGRTRSRARQNQATKRQRAVRPDPKHFRSQFSCEAHNVSLIAAGRSKDTRLPQPYEDEEARRICRGGGARGRKRVSGERGLYATRVFLFSPGGWIFDHRSPATPEKCERMGEMPRQDSTGAAPSAKNTRTTSACIGEPKAFVGIDELLFSCAIERGPNWRGAARGTDRGPVLGGAVEGESHPAAL